MNRQASIRSLSYDFSKRLFDVLLASLGLIIIAPLSIVVAIIIRLDSKGPILFRQIRVGKNFAPFTVYKFRTMANAPSEGDTYLAVSQESRITRAGMILRKTKIDELPQLINILRGNMSFVGPRPELPVYVEMFKDDYKEILRIKPGITDYAAVEFRDEERILDKYDDPGEGYINDVLPEKIKLYKRYLSEGNFWVDIKLILLTLRKILK